jgi:hypothetical protein
MLSIGKFYAYTILGRFHKESAFQHRTFAIIKSACPAATEIQGNFLEKENTAALCNDLSAYACAMRFSTLNLSEKFGR